MEVLVSFIITVFVNTIYCLLLFLDTVSQVKIEAMFTSVSPLENLGALVQKRRRWIVELSILRRIVE